MGPGAHLGCGPTESGWRSHTRVTPSEVRPARPPSVFPTEPRVGPSSPSLCGARTFPDENTSGSVPHAPFISDTREHRPPHTAVNADFTHLDTALKPPPKRTLSSARASSSPSGPQGPRPCPSSHTGRRGAGPNVPLSALLVQGAEPQPSVNREQEMSVRGRAPPTPKAKPRPQIPADPARGTGRSGSKTFAVQPLPWRRRRRRGSREMLPGRRDPPRGARTHPMRPSLQGRRADHSPLGPLGPGRLWPPGLGRGLPRGLPTTPGTAPGSGGPPRPLA